MIDPITDRDIARQVTRALDDDTAGHDIDAITEAIIDAHGRVDIDAIDHDDFWAIVAAHALPEQDPAQAFEAQILALADQQQSSGDPVVWQGDGVTVSIGGSGYVQDRPSPHAQIAITTPDGWETRVCGEDVRTWAEVWEHVRIAQQSWADDAATLLGRAVRAQRAVDRTEVDLQRARVARDAVVRRAHREGVSAYRIAAEIGVSQKHVGTIVKR